MGNVLNRPEKDTCRQKDPKWKILSATAYLISILFFILLFFFFLKPQLFHQAVNSGLSPPVQTTELLLVKKVLGSHKQPRKQSSVVLCIAQSASHRSNEGGSFAAAVFRKQECHVAFGRQILYRLVHDLWKAAESREAVKNPSSTQLKMALSSKQAGWDKDGMGLQPVGKNSICGKVNTCPVAGAMGAWESLLFPVCDDVTHVQKQQSIYCNTAPSILLIPAQL